MEIVGLCGFKDSGKSTVAKHLVDNYGFVEITMAKPLKDITSIIYGFDRDMLEGDTEEKRHLRETIRDPIWGRTGREALQYLGTDVIRTYHDTETWVKIAMREVKKIVSSGKSVVISDLRFINEYSQIINIGGNVWEISRRNFTDQDIESMHSSEKSFLAFPSTHQQIKNHGTIDELKHTIDKIMKL